MAHEEVDVDQLVWEDSQLQELEMKRYKAEKNYESCIARVSAAKKSGMSAAVIETLVREQEEADKICYDLLVTKTILVVRKIVAKEKAKAKK